MRHPRFAPAFELLHGQLGMSPRDCDSVPDERKQGVWKPVQPAQVLQASAVGQPEVEPHVEELVWAQTRDEVRSKAVRE